MSIATRVQQLLPQTSTEGVTVADYVTSAIAVFSRYRPKLVTEEVTVTTPGYEFSLPTSWVNEFSRVDSVEYPAGQNPPAMLRSDNYFLYRTSTGLKLRFSYQVQDKYIITYTTLWTESGLSTYDAESVAILASALICDELAAKYAGSIDDVVQTVSGLWKTKSREYMDARKNFLNTFYIRTGIDLQGGRSSPAVIYQQESMPTLKGYRVNDWSDD